MNNSVFKLIRWSGLPWLCRETVQRRKVTILMFHDIDADSADRAFSYLGKHYHVISLQHYLEARQSGTRLPSKALIITFDDGHAGNYALLPVIRRLQIPVTIFLCSDIVGTRRHFWFKHSEDLLPDRERLKRLPNDERLEALLKYGYELTRDYDDRHALTSEQIVEMRQWVDFQSHTCFHPILTQCDDETARAEIALSKAHLERDYGLHINTISYPNGDYAEREVEMAQEAGYTCGITVDPGYNDSHTDLLRLKRFSVNDTQSMDELVVKASGCFALMKQFLRKLKH